MSDSLRHAWPCPLCARQVPVHIDTCRCGYKRDDNDLPPEAVDARQTTAPAASTRIQTQTSTKSLPGLFLGYRTDAFVPRFWRLSFKTVLIGTVALVWALAGSLISHGSEPPRTHGKIEVLSRLDEYTKTANPKTLNTIPAFLALPGRVGVLEIGSDPDALSRESIKDVNEAELKKGVCSPSVALLIRQQYPGSYDDWSNADLQKKVLAKHPEYRDRLCILPAWIDAAPHDIVKYQSESQTETPAAPLKREPVLLWAGLGTAAFVFLALNAYYRLLVARFRPL